MAELKGKILAGKVLIEPQEAEKKQLVVLSFLIQLKKTTFRESCPGR